MTVTVINSSGLTKTDTLYVNIVKTSSETSKTIEENKEYVVGGIVVVLLAVIVIFWYNKKRKQKTNSTN